MKKLILIIVITIALLLTTVTNGQSLAYKLAIIELTVMDYGVFSGKNLYDLESYFSSLFLRLDEYYILDIKTIADYTAHTQNKLKTYGVKTSMLKIMNTAMKIEYNKISYKTYCEHYYALKKRRFTSNQIALRINMQL